MNEGCIIYFVFDKGPRFLQKRSESKDTTSSTKTTPMTIGRRVPPLLSNCGFRRGRGGGHHDSLSSASRYLPSTLSLDAMPCLCAGAL